ncbi:type II toxin-antitoxin system HicB family antitoxin [Rhodoblastus sp.]|uniref:type II toxin-antitoxin system HicB family antitoxin n=1 Tax=Rhodoblastus sp. TaxID=1962975 RepID=UPI003F989959
MLGYRIEIEPDDNDTFLVTCPALPELTTFGDNQGDAALHALGAVEEALAARISEGREIPQLEAEAGEGACFAPLPILTALKVGLYRALQEEKITRAELQRRLHWPHREQVDRLFRQDHASQFPQIEAAFRALHRSHEISIKNSHAA